MADVADNTQDNSAQGTPAQAAAPSNDGVADSASAQNSAKADSLLDGILGGGDNGDEHTTEGSEPLIGGGEGSDDAASPSDDSAAAPETPDVDPVEEILNASQQAALAQIVPSLLEAGIPKEVVGQWIKNNPKGLVEWANGLQAKANGNTPKADAAPVDPTIDLDALVKPMAEILGEDATPHLTEFGKSIYTNSLKAYEKAHANWRTREFQPVFEHVSKLTGAVEQLMLRAARAESVTKYPDLGKPAQRDQVETKARKLFQTGDYDSFDAAYEDACKLVFAPGAIKAQQAAIAQTKKFKQAGGMNPVTNSGKPKLTAEQVADRVADMALAGKTPSEINAWKASVGHKD